MQTVHSIQILKRELYLVEKSVPSPLLLLLDLLLILVRIQVLLPPPLPPCKVLGPCSVGAGIVEVSHQDPLLLLCRLLE